MLDYGLWHLLSLQLHNARIQPSLFLHLTRQGQYTAGSSMGQLADHKFLQGGVGLQKFMSYIVYLGLSLISWPLVCDPEHYGKGWPCSNNRIISPFHSSLG